MEGLVAIIAVLATFATPVMIVREVLASRERRARFALDGARKALPAGDGPDLAALKAERDTLRERVENLESIVCGVDYSLNQKLSRLIDEQRLGQAAGAEPAAASAAPTADARSPEPPAALARTATAAIVTEAPPPSVSGLGPGVVLANRYRIERLLGRGGMGAVYLAHDEVLDEAVALKVIASAFAADEPAMIERFRREAAAARKVTSPNVVRIHDLGEARPGLLYLSMEYFPGKTLAEVITARGMVPVADALEYLRQICTGLAAAHAASVIHRDLKPHNVLVGDGNTVKLIDFGLAKATTASLTATGLLLGTPHYMSPEQVRGKTVDAQSDLYSLGALAYHLFAGRPPFSGDNPIAIGFAHCSEPVPPLAGLRKELPAPVVEIVMRALAKTPAERPQSVAEFRAALG